MTWTKDAVTGDFILTVILAPGQSVLDTSFSAYHTHSKDGVIHPDQTLHLTLKSVSVADGLSADLHTGDPDRPFTLGDQLEFTVMDAHYAQLEAWGALRGFEVSHAEADGRHLVYGTEGDDVIYATDGNDILVGGGGNDVFVWSNDTMGHDGAATDIIKDFDVEHNSLRFEDLFHGAENASAALESLLKGQDGNTVSWDGATFTATAADGSAGIQLNIADQVATLQVSYSDQQGTHMQNVELQGLNVADHFSNTSSTEELAHMLQSIIRVGGNS
jgi:hypothetical protein